jgi:hypothetical protein
MAIKVAIGTYSKAERENEFIEVVDALISAKSDKNPTPQATFEVAKDKLGSTKRQMREAANARDFTARLVETVETKTGVTLSYILTERITRNADKDAE